MTDPEIERGVRRVVGFAALRRLRRMVDADAAAAARKSALALRLGWMLAAAALLAVLWIAFR